MRTARALTVSPGMLCAGRGLVYVGPGGVLSPGGVSARGVCLLRVGLLTGEGRWRGVCSQGVSALGRRLSALGGCLLGGVNLVGGVPAQALPPLLTEFLTHAYENITLPQISFAGGNYPVSQLLSVSLLPYGEGPQKWTN